MQTDCSPRSAWPVTLAGLVMAFAPVHQSDLVPVAETADGFMFSLRLSSVAPHPLGHRIELQGLGSAPRKLRRSDPASPEFQRVESQWVVDCKRGAFGIVVDRFYDAEGTQVEHFDGDPQDLEVPEFGSVSHMIVRASCGRILRTRTP